MAEMLRFGMCRACYDTAQLGNQGSQPMWHAPFADYDFCDFVTFALAGTAFLLCLYMEVAA